MKRKETKNAVHEGDVGVPMGLGARIMVVRRGRRVVEVEVVMRERADEVLGVLRRLPGISGAVSAASRLRETRGQYIFFPKRDAAGCAHSISRAIKWKKKTCADDAFSPTATPVSGDVVCEGRGQLVGFVAASCDRAANGGACKSDAPRTTLSEYEGAGDVHSIAHKTGSGVWEQGERLD
ncbi:hypothetical protein B0H19DRAFT_1065375 [Mycena capillaripes]|nr:hypothetical protein B0H19DRAFT_1065375 [Mycena capillaripes]